MPLSELKVPSKPRNPYAPIGEALLVEMNEYVFPETGVVRHSQSRCLRIIKDLSRLKYQNILITPLIHAADLVQTHQMLDAKRSKLSAALPIYNITSRLKVVPQYLLDSELTKAIELQEIRTLPGGKLLVRPPRSLPVRQQHKLLEQILKSGLTPVLVEPESSLFRNGLSNVIALRDSGCLFQLNLNKIMDRGPFSNRKLHVRSAGALEQFYLGSGISNINKVSLIKAWQRDTLFQECLEKGKILNQQLLELF